LEVVTVLVGTDEDPQDLESERRQLEQAGAIVETSNEAAARHAGRLIRTLGQPAATPPAQPIKPVELGMLQQPMAAVNVGLESFAESLVAQGAQAIQVDWRPPAGGNERLMAILERMKG